MNRLEFMHNVDLQSNEFTTIVPIFDQIMLLYNLTNEYNNTKLIYKGVDTENRVQFKMQGDKEEIDSLCQNVALCNSNVNIYGRAFDIHANKKKTEADIYVI